MWTWLRRWARERFAGGPARVAPNADGGTEVARPFRRRAGLADGAPATKDLRGKFCSKPWDHFEAHPDGNVWVCCPKWLDTPVGNLGRDDVPTIWNSRTLQKIRASILDGSFRYCVQAECPLIQSNGLPDAASITDPRLRRIIDSGEFVSSELPRLYNLCYDESCNLECPSCRRNRIHFSEGKEFESRARIQQRIVDTVFAAPHDHPVHLSVTGSGDPFGSVLFRDLLSSLRGSDFPNLVVDLQTNGVLFTPANWQRIAGLHGHVNQVMISFDAARPATYAYTRRGGNWERLQQNVAFVAGLRQRGDIRWLRLDFVVQQRNYTEMGEFVELAESFGAVDQVSFNLITDWGTYGADFAQHAIWRASHPEFAAFLAALRDPRLARPKVHLGNVAGYHDLALREAMPPAAAAAEGA